MSKRGFIVACLLLSGFSAGAQTGISEAARRFWNNACKPAFGYAKDFFLKSYSDQNLESYYVTISPYKKTFFLDAKAYNQFYDIYMPTTGLTDYLPKDMQGLYPTNWTDLMFTDARIKSHKSCLDLGMTWGSLSLTLPIPISSNFDRNYGLASYGSAFGFSIRYRQLRNPEGSQINGIQQMNDSVYFRLIECAQDPSREMDQSPIEPVREELEAGKMRLNTFYADAYYVFNHKRFSLAAARTGMNIQKNSAGSVIAMANYNHSYLKMTRLMNAEHDYFRHSQMSIGAGYGYNLSLWGGKACIQGTLIPMVAVSNKVTHSAENNGYSSINSPTENPSSEWYEFDRNFYNAIDNNSRSRFTLNCFARLGAIYNFERILVSANCEYRRYLFRNSSSCKINNTQLDFTVRVGWRW